ncbi:hypothetical protein PSAB_17045 [Paenibacillus sabinae T27]|uniref:Uncharacterized protein n=1 Tax=Paenibacillus sabinae T27 TaxID=1268072 RepID=X4ZFL4_9BACL|nr:hypothetical protein PSAB_17045 [Paenibacillus sabinae T27]
MKILLLYVLLCFLGLSMTVFVDLISGMSLFSTLQSLRTTLRTANSMETTAMALFFSAPFIVVIVDSLTNKKRQKK